MIAQKPVYTLMAGFMPVEGQAQVKSSIVFCLMKRMGRPVLRPDNDIRLKYGRDNLSYIAKHFVVMVNLVLMSKPAERILCGDEV